MVKAGYILNDVIKLTMHSLMVIIVVIAYNKLRTLDVNEHHTSLLDDVLLYICIPFFIAETLFTLIATFFVVNVVKSVDVIVMVSYSTVILLYIIRVYTYPILTSNFL